MSLELNGEIIEIEDDDTLTPPEGARSPPNRTGNLSMINKGIQCNLIRKRQYIRKNTGYKNIAQRSNGTFQVQMVVRGIRYQKTVKTLELAQEIVSKWREEFSK